MLATNRRERLAYAEQAAAVAEQAKAIKAPEDRLRTLGIASELAAFAKDMPRPRSRHDVLRESLGLEHRAIRAPGLRAAQPHIDRASASIRGQLREVGGDGGDRVKEIEARLSRVASTKARGPDGPERTQ